MDNTQKIITAFKREGLSIVDQEQIAELKRWSLDDFKAPHDFIQDKHVSQNPVISVCGGGRSGTTLTRVILDTHSQIYSGPESYLFLPIPIDSVSLAEKFQFDTRDISKVIHQSSSRSEFIEHFSAMILDRFQKPLWVDKTSRNIHTADYFFSHFPEGKLIHVVRDPRDAIASLRTHRKRKLVNGEIVNTGYIMPLSLCIDRWNLAAQDVLSHRDKPNFLEIKYEDLIQNPEQTIRKLCHFCGVGYESAMMDFDRVSSPTRDAKKFIQNIEATKPIFSSSVGRHTHELSEAQTERIIRATSELAKHFGYNL